MKIKANQELFDEVRKLAQELQVLTHKIDSLSHIVQNDMEVTQEDIDGWNKIVRTTSSEVNDTGYNIASSILRWRRKVLAYLDPQTLE